MQWFEVVYSLKLALNPVLIQILLIFYMERKFQSSHLTAFDKYAIGLHF
jgi:hypothetical protein